MCVWRCFHALKLSLIICRVVSIQLLEWASFDMNALWEISKETRKINEILCQRHKNKLYYSCNLLCIYQCLHGAASMRGVERTEHQLNGWVFLSAHRQMCLVLFAQHKMTIIVRAPNEVCTIWCHPDCLLILIHALICNYLKSKIELFN